VKGPKKLQMWAQVSQKVDLACKLGRRILIGFSGGVNLDEKDIRKVVAKRGRDAYAKKGSIMKTARILVAWSVFASVEGNSRSEVSKRGIPLNWEGKTKQRIFLTREGREGASDFCVPSPAGPWRALHRGKSLGREQWRSSPRMSRKVRENTVWMGQVFVFGGCLQVNLDRRRETNGWKPWENLRWGDHAV